MILPFDIINIIISFLKPKYIYNFRLINKYYSRYILRKNLFNFSKLKPYDLIYAVKRNNINLIDWLLRNKMFHKKILTYSIVYSNKKTIYFILKKAKIYKILNSNLILAKQRVDDPDIYNLVVDYYKLDKFKYLK